MRIEMLKTYRGPLGRFLKGYKYDLNPHVAKQLPEGWYKCIDTRKQNDDRQSKTQKPRPPENQPAKGD